MFCFTVCKVTAAVLSSLSQLVSHWRVRKEKNYLKNNISRNITYGLYFSAAAADSLALSNVQFSAEYSLVRLLDRQISLQGKIGTQKANCFKGRMEVRTGGQGSLEVNTRF